MKTADFAAYAVRWRRRERFYNIAYTIFFLSVLAICSGFVYIQYLYMSDDISDLTKKLD